METNLKIRYSRQMAIPGFGETRQEMLSRSKVFVVGCGALGSMVSMQLAGAGVGNIHIADFDTVDISNLQRQFFFKTKDAGKMKVELMYNMIVELNPEINVLLTDSLVDRKIGIESFRDCDFVIDATDNPASKAMTEDACRSLGKVCCIGGVSGFHGQVATLMPDGVRLSEILGDVETEGVMPCSSAGVAGPAAALCASLQASEAIKHLTGINRRTQSSLTTFDLVNNEFNTYEM